MEGPRTDRKFTGRVRLRVGVRNKVRVRVRKVVGS